MVDEDYIIESSGIAVKLFFKDKIYPLVFFISDTFYAVQLIHLMTILFTFPRTPIWEIPSTAAVTLIMMVCCPLIIY